MSLPHTGVLDAYYLRLSTLTPSFPTRIATLLSSERSAGDFHFSNWAMIHEISWSSTNDSDTLSSSESLSMCTLNVWAERSKSFFCSIPRLGMLLDRYCSIDAYCFSLIDVSRLLKINDTPKTIYLFSQL